MSETSTSPLLSSLGPSYTPPRRVLDDLIALYLQADGLAQGQQQAISTALHRVPLEAFRHALLRLAKTSGPDRVHLATLLGRLGVAATQNTDEPVSALLGLLEDA